MAFTAAEETALKALVNHANRTQFTEFLNALSADNWDRVKRLIVTALTTETIADRDGRAKTAKEALIVAEAAWQEFESRFYAARDVVQLSANESMSTVNQQFSTERQQKQSALEAARAAVATIEAEGV